MKSRRLYLIVLVVLMGSAFLVGALTLERETGSRPVVVLEPDVRVVKQSQTSRLLRSPEWRLDFLLGDKPSALDSFSQGEPDFFYLVTGRAGPDGSFYALDSGDFGVKKVVDGELVARYGKGEGSGPGEFMGPMDVAVDEQGQVYVADPVSGAVTVFSADGEVIQTLRQEVQPERVTLGPKGHFVTSSSTGPDGIFSVHGPDGTTSFGAIVDKPQHAIAFGGWLDHTLDGLVFSPLYFGMLMNYDFDGNVNWIAETIDPVPPPKVVFGDDGWITLDPKAQPVHYSVSATDDHIFTLSRRARGGLRKRGVVDVYDRTNGHYRYSFALPGPGKGIVVDADRLYTFTATELRRWSLAGGDDVLGKG